MSTKERSVSYVRYQTDETHRGLYNIEARVVVRPRTSPVDNPLNAFRRNPDGSWTCIAPITLKHPTGRIEVASGSTFIEGRNFMGVDLAEWLDAMDRAHTEPASSRRKEGSQMEAPES